MARPSLALGTYGNVYTAKYGDVYRARARYRDFDGRTRLVERHAKTKGAAEQALRTALRDRARVDVGTGAITAETKVAVLAEEWFESVQKQDRSPNTTAAYRARLDKSVIPGLGELRIRELTVGVIDRFLSIVTEKHGAATAKMIRSVLSGMCGLAARHDALDRNVVRDAGPIAEATPKKQPRALTLDQLRELRSALRNDPKAVRRDLPEFVDLLMSTGARIGEAAGLTWGAVNLDEGWIEIRSTVVRITGQGLVNKPKPKSKSGYRRLQLPSWMVRTLKQRFDDQPDDAPVFPAPLGGLRDPSNTQADLRDAFKAVKMDWATSHIVGRKSVASAMDSAGLSARAAADQLGHRHVSMTQDRYYGRQVAETGAAAILELLDT
ncbi:site-specific integrase [Frankia sp. CcI49]|uniref:site-specific integrase n=1 Tax=Frankia sp. CcI49 TaxID=1745382 RepID=UPI000977AEAB|nr:site-specific integrase [Frankia sp. CcI49]ONH49593.1 site-specific integrase [Frankia sp. CcI49]